MTSSAESGKGGGGVFSMLGRLFGRGGRAEDVSEPAVDDRSGAPETLAGEASQAAPAEQADPADAAAGPAPRESRDADNGDEMVLGPELQAAPADDEADELTLTGESSSDDSGEGGAAVEPEEEAIIAKLRRSLQEQDATTDAPGERAGVRSEDEWAAGFEQVEATSTPEEDSGNGLAARSGDVPDEGELAEGDEGPEGPLLMEVEEMGRDDKTKQDDEVAQEGEDEAPAGAVPLFPGAQAAEAAEDEGAAPDADESPAAARDESADDEPDIDEPAAEGTEDTEAMTEEPEAAEAEAPGTDEAEAGEPETAETGESEPVSDAEVLVLAAAVESGEDPAAGDFPTDPSEEWDFEEAVRKLIRQELEGELGERLSGNIRRMIREEVAHALLRQR